MRVALAALIMLTATPVLAAEIGCDGVFNASTTLADIEAAYGKDNVVTGEVPGPEGMTYVATTIYPGDAEREMQVRWWDEDAVKDFAGVTLGKGDTGPLGIKVGMSVEEVEAINGEPFGFFGFFWDYGGGGSFQSGKLAEVPGGCIVNVRMTPTLDPLPEDISNAISGDRELRSDQKEVRAAKVVVEEINLNVPYPYDEEEGEGEEYTEEEGA